MRLLLSLDWHPSPNWEKNAGLPNLIEAKSIQCAVFICLEQILDFGDAPSIANSIYRYLVHFRQLAALLDLMLALSYLIRSLIREIWAYTAVCEGKFPQNPAKLKNLELPPDSSFLTLLL
jgi:hypothetical protein